MNKGRYDAGSIMKIYIYLLTQNLNWYILLQQKRRQFYKLSYTQLNFFGRQSYKYHTTLHIQDVQMTKRNW